jgi:hypothetical protein
MARTDQAQERARWRAFVEKVILLWSPQNAGNFWTS